MTQETIGIGMVSFWHLHGKDYAEAAETNPHTRIVAVWDEDPSRGRVEADARGVPYYEDLDDLLADPAVDAVVVDSQTNLHVDVIPRCAAAGKHVFTEKVLAATTAEADIILDAIRSSGVAMTVSMWRADRAYTLRIAELIGAGTIGDVVEVRARDGHALALPSPDAPEGRLPAQFYDPEQAQGGILIDLCHPLYLTARLLGLPQSVHATLGHYTGRTVEDNAAVVMRYPNGALAIAETSSISAVSPFSVEVHGTAGSILYAETGIGELSQQYFLGVAPDESGDGPDGHLHVRSTVDGAPAHWEAIRPGSSLPIAFDQWVEHIRTDTRDQGNLDLARALTILVEATYQSDRTGHRVEISAPRQPRSS